MKKIYGWHFLQKNRTLRYGDDRYVSPGKTYTSGEEAPRLCEYGMHASRKALDALRFAPGSVVCRVRCWGDVLVDNDKFVARNREVLWMANVEDALHRFARMCALDVVHLWDPPAVVLRYLKTGDPTLRAEAKDAADAAYVAGGVGLVAAAYATYYAARVRGSACVATNVTHAATNAALATNDKYFLRRKQERRLCRLLSSAPRFDA